MQRLLPPQLVLLLGSAGSLLHLVIRPSVIVPTAFRLLGLAAVAGGLAMSIGGSRQFDARGTNIKTFGRPDHLVSDGQFRWSRNPMYLGFVFALVGLAMGIGSWLAFTAPVLFFGASERWYIPFEEREMRCTFGAEYEQYCQEVRRWLGRRSLERT